MGKSKFIIIFIVFSLFSCNKKSILSKDDIEEFIPINYKIANIHSSKSPIENSFIFLNVDEDPDNELLVLLECSERVEGNEAKLLLFDFENGLSLLDSINLKGEVIYDVNLTDFNNDNKNEIHIKNGIIGTNYGGIYQEVIMVDKNKKGYKVFDEDNFSTYKFEYCRDNNLYLKIEYEYGNGEHINSGHYYYAKFYQFIDNRYKFVGQKYSKRKYSSSRSEAPETIYYSDTQFFYDININCY